MPIKKKQHTPGPWVVEERPIGKWGHLVSLGGPDDAEITVKNADPDIELADALLISAAPELKEALLLWQEFWDKMPGGQLVKIACDIGILNQAFLKTSAALAKVKGGK